VKNASEVARRTARIKAAAAEREVAEALPRRIKTYREVDGKIVETGEITHGDAVIAVARRTAVEVAANKPKARKCRDCKLFVVRKRYGLWPHRCARCRVARAKHKSQEHYCKNKERVLSARRAKYGKDIEKSRTMSREQSRARRARCPEKIRESQRAHRARNIEKIRAKGRAAAKASRDANIKQARERERNWRRKNLAKVREQERSYREKHRDEIKARKRAKRSWAKENPEKVRERQQRYHENHRDEINAKSRARRAAKAVAAGRRIQPRVSRAENIVSALSTRDMSTRELAISAFGDGTEKTCHAVGNALGLLKKRGVVIPVWGGLWRLAATA